MEIALFFFWLVALGFQVAIAVFLYRLGEQRFDAGMPWAIAGFTFGFIAVGAFFLFVMRAEAMERTKARTEFTKIKGVLQHHRETADEYRAATTTNMDPEVDALIANHRLDEARSYVNEKIRVAYEMGDNKREEMYRRYLQIIEGNTDWPGER